MNYKRQMGTGKENNLKTSLNDVESGQWIVKYQYLILFQVFCGFQFYFCGRKKKLSEKNLWQSRLEWSIQQARLIFKDFYLFSKSNSVFSMDRNRFSSLIVIYHDSSMLRPSFMLSL